MVTVNTHNPSWTPAAAQAINDHVRAMPRIVVADWDQALVPTDFDAADNPHPNETGRQHLIAVEDAAINRCSQVTP